jgi:flagellar basal-body rod protein FlgB
VELSDVTQQALGAALRGAQARHQALAGNIANATTPGYVRQDVEFHSALESAIAAGRSPRETVFTARQDPAAGAIRADGGTIDIDAESAKLAANTLEYQAIVAVKEARGAAVKAALGVG